MASRALTPANDAYDRFASAARTKPEPATGMDAAYRASIAVLHPGCDDLTATLRVNLMAMRDRASLALNRCCDEAIPILAEANRIASLAALSNAPARTLGFTLSAVESLIFAAQMLQRGQDGR